MFHRIPSGCPLTWWQRALLALGSMVLLAGFAVAYGLSPDPRGFGTHQQLGLPPCTFRMMFGVSCPSCGATTSFSHFVQGNWVAAVRCNPAAMLLAMISAAVIPWSWYSVYAGRLWGMERPDVVLLQLLLIVCGAALLQWGCRVLIGY